MDRFHASTTVLNKARNDVFFWLPVNSCEPHLSIFSISRKYLEMADLVFQHFVQAYGLIHVRGSASTTSLKVSSLRDRFLPIYLINVIKPFITLPNHWNHLSAVRTGTDPSENASLMLIAV